MQTVQAPREIFNKAAGWMILKPTTDGLQVFIREDRTRIGLYPRPCSVDFRLPSWDMPPVTAAAFMVNAGRQERLTFQAWINTRAISGVQVLTNLSTERRIHVHIVTDTVVRSIKSPNIVKRQAQDLLRRLSSKSDQWSEQELLDAQERISRLYPSSWRMWNTMKREQRG